MATQLPNTTISRQSEDVNTDILIGKLIQSVDNNTQVTTKLCGQVDDLKEEQGLVAITFGHINRDIIEIRKGMHDAASISDIVDKRLAIYGLDKPHECLLDNMYTRNRRLNGSALKKRICIAVITSIVLCSLLWTGNAMLEKFKHDIQQEQTK